ncbi:MAG: hypothetical protein V4507_04105 [Verrucomicrobiota bacterium]
MKNAIRLCLEGRALGVHPVIHSRTLPHVRDRPSRERRDNAFSLVEVVLAMGILSFCMVLLMGLLPVGLKTNEISAEESKALNLMTAIVSDLKYTPSNNPKSAIFGLTGLPYATVSGGKTNLIYLTEGWKVQEGDKPQPTSRYQVMWWYTHISGANERGPVEGVVRVSWPARPKEMDVKWDASSETYVTFWKNGAVQ